MVIDSSAVVAIVRREPEGPAMMQALNSASRLAISGFTVFETETVLLRRFAGVDIGSFDKLLADMGVEVVPFDRAQAELAYEAYGRFGKGSGLPAQLNLGDCAAYALAKSLNLPLLYKGNDFVLYKGNDFVHTDIVSAL